MLHGQPFVPLLLEEVRRQEGLHSALPIHRLLADSIQIPFVHHKVVDIVDDRLPVDTVHVVLLLEEEVAQVQVKRNVAARTADVVLVELVQNLQDQRLPLVVERHQIQTLHYFIRDILDDALSFHDLMVHIIYLITISNY